MRLINRMGFDAVGLLFMSVAAGNALALYIPNQLSLSPYTDYGDMNSSITVNGVAPVPIFKAYTPIPSTFALAETNIQACCAPLNGATGKFERNEHQIRFATAGVDAGVNGHPFQRHEAWDYAFDLKIESTHPDVRKEAGIYFKSPIGNSMFIATSNDTFYGSGPGQLTSIYPDVLPVFSYSGSNGPLGDYNLNGTADAADYSIWQDTLGSTTDFRANGNNDPPSTDLIDQADFDVWKAHFGQGPTAPTLSYHPGDTVRMRLIYTPPVLADPNLPDVANDPNVTTPAKIEYRVSINGGSVFSSGALDFTNTWKGIPNGTTIQFRAQSLSTATANPDSATYTWSNFDFNGDLPGTGLGAGAGGGFAGGVPEPGTFCMAAIGSLFAVAVGWRRGRK